MWADPWVAIHTILTLLGGFAVIAGGLVSVSYSLFKALGSKWLDAKFQERLAAYQHAQQRELETLKFQINTLMDRTVKLHQREFDVLPEAWGRLTDAFHLVRSVGLGFRQYPDVNKMSSSEFDEWIEKTALQNWEKQELRSAPDRTAYYSNALAWHNLWKAEEVHREFQIYLSKNGIFVPDDLKRQFVALDAMLQAALMERRFAMQHPGVAETFDKGQVLHEEGSRLLSQLEGDVQLRLWNSQAVKL